MASICHLVTWYFNFTIAYEGGSLAVANGGQFTVANELGGDRRKCHLLVFNVLCPVSCVLCFVSSVNRAAQRKGEVPFCTSFSPFLFFLFPPSLVQVHS